MTQFELLDQFPFMQVSDPERVVHLNVVARGLLEMFSWCRDTGESTAVLTWPTRVANLAVLHALAELQGLVSAAENAPPSEPAPPLTTLFWPWNQGCEIAQKRILVDREGLVDGNLRFMRLAYNDQHSVGSAFHMGINCIRDLDPARRITGTRGHRHILPNHPELQHPTLYELSPQATVRPSSSKKLVLSTDCLMDRSSKYIRSCPSLSDTRLAEWETAPFFMVGILAGVPLDDLGRCRPLAGRRPNMVVLDLTNVEHRLGQSWIKQVKAFLAALEKIYSESSHGIPPVLAITETPFVFNLVHSKLLPDYEETRRGKRAVSTYSYLNLTQGIFDKKDALGKESPTPEVTVVSFSDDMADLAIAGQELRDVARELGSDELAEEVNRLTQVLRNLVNMPGGMDDYIEFLQDFCAETGVDIRTVALRPNDQYVRVKEQIEAGAAGASRIEAEIYLESCKNLIASFAHKTPLQCKLEELYELLLSRPGRFALVLPNRQMKGFALWMFYNKYPHLRGTIESNERVVFFDSREAMDLIESVSESLNHVYWVLPRQKHLAQLLAQHAIPEHITFICDASTVLSLLNYVQVLLNVPGMSLLKPRLSVVQIALATAAGNRIKLLGQLDETTLLTNSFLLNLRESEHATCQGHPVVLFTEEGTQIPAFEGSEVLKFQEESDLQPFVKTPVSGLQPGERFFVITPDFIEAASDKINITAMASETLRVYHSRVVERVKGISGYSLRDKAENIQKRMKDGMIDKDIGEAENVSNILRWINVEPLLKMPREFVKPHAPKIRKVFRLFMQALNVPDTEIDWYWVAAIQTTRKVRVRAGLDRNRVFYRLLLDPASVDKFFTGDKGDLRTLVDIACRNVFTITRIAKEHQDGTSAN